MRQFVVPGWAVLGLLGASLLIIGQAMPTSVAADSFPVTLKGVGDSDIVGELTQWQNTLFEATQPSDVQYFQVGSKEGRGQLLRGQADFAFGGVPFLDTELAARPAGAGEIISVPLAVGSTAIVVSDAAQSGFTTSVIPCTPEEYAADPFQDACLPVPGPAPTIIRIPPENLSALITGLPRAVSSLTQWRDPSWAEAMGTDRMQVQLAAQSHTFLNRAEAASQNKYLMEYAKALGPTAWALRKADNPQFRWEPIGEIFSPRVPSKSGLDTQLFFMSQPNDPISNGTLDGRWSGNIGPVPTTLVDKLTSDYPKPVYRVAEIQNAHGDWVTPTQASIDAALAVGTQPDIAALQNIPDAYPLVYINNVFTIAGTLTPEKANALAAFIRYVATDGQQLIVDHGSTSLPASLRSQALAGANEIVVKNCTKAGFEVSSSGVSAYEPATPGVQSIGPMKHCTVIPAPPPTTSTPTSTTTTSTPSTTTTSTTTLVQTAPTVASLTPSSPFNNAAEPAARPPNPPSVATKSTTPLAPVAVADGTTTTTSPPAVVPATSTTTAPPPTGGGGTRPRGVSLAQLPMAKPPTGAEDISRLGTLLLGAAVYLGGRRGVLARRAQAT